MSDSRDVARRFRHVNDRYPRTVSALVDTLFVAAVLLALAVVSGSAPMYGIFAMVTGFALIITAVLFVSERVNGPETSKRLDLRGRARAACLSFGVLGIAAVLSGAGLSVATFYWAVAAVAGLIWGLVAVWRARRSE